MGDKTKIEWTNRTWNPWQGCHKVSAGCANCYMYREKLRYGQDPTVVVRSKPGTFNSPLKWKEPGLVFTCSWSDFFVKESDDWRSDAWDIIRRTPHLTYQILTKRPERIGECLPKDWGNGWKNVWMGVTVETNEYRHRIAEMKDTPAVLYFVSVEPMLGPVNLIWDLGTPTLRANNWPLVDWVIAGCESGPKARPMELDWVRGLRDQCVGVGVPFFLKQLVVAGKLTKMPELDGKVWDQVPVTLRSQGKWIED